MDYNHLLWHTTGVASGNNYKPWLDNMCQFNTINDCEQESSPTTPKSSNYDLSFFYDSQPTPDHRPIFAA
jgi:hypothetical protein